MENIFNFINNIFSSVSTVSDMLWDFPTNIGWYAAIPILGKLSFTIILLVGTGIYFTFRTGFIQMMSFGPAIKIMRKKQRSAIGVSAFASFMLGLAMRAGPGNIVGVTGAISIGGPGALFWMWVASFFGMSTAFVESVLAQLYKEKKGDEFVGGLPFYGRHILNNKRFIGLILSVSYIAYALLNVPVQTFNVFSAIGMVAETATGTVYARDSTLYYVISVLLVLFCAGIIFGGIRRVVAYSNILVPIKATLFCLISLTLIVINFPLIPYFFKAVLVGAFSPESIFGGAIGVVIAQGVKRGLMVNEAGQGTLTMAASVANNSHPCEQGLIQSFGVFFDTMVICTLTGFIVVMAHLWTGVATGAEWEVLRSSKIGLYLASVQELTPTAVESGIKILMAICYGMFAFTTLLGMISFSEVSANFISKKRSFILFIRGLGALFFVPFGALTILAGLELGNLWYLTDLLNIIMVYLNLPILLIGAHLVYKTLAHYRRTNGGLFISKEEGFETPYWNKDQK